MGIVAALIAGKVITGNTPSSDSSATGHDYTGYLGCYLEKLVNCDAQYPIEAVEVKRSALEVNSIPYAECLDRIKNQYPDMRPLCEAEHPMGQYSQQRLDIMFPLGLRSPKASSLDLNDPATLRFAKENAISALQRIKESDNATAAASAKEDAIASQKAKETAAMPILTKCLQQYAVPTAAQAATCHDRWQAAKN
jgi:hypothetical protein